MGVDKVMVREAILQLITRQCFICSSPTSSKYPIKSNGIRTPRAPKPQRLRHLFVSVALTLPMVAPSTAPAAPVATSDSLHTYLVAKPIQSQFPDMRSNYEKTVVEPQRAAQAALEARQAAEAAAQAQAAQEAQIAAQTPTFEGEEGYSLAGGNCVNQAGVNNPGFGNPIDWPITSTTPWIGASVLFYFNHVAVVTGIWSNGDIEVGQQNCPGCAHRFAVAEVRGFR